MSPKPHKSITKKKNSTRSNVPRSQKSSLGSSLRLSRRQLLLVIAGVVALGALIVWFVRAGSLIATEPESWPASGGNVKTVADSTASGGNYVEFLAPTVSPASSVVTYPDSPGAVASSSYQLSVGGKTVFVEKYKDISYARLALTGSASATVTASQAITSSSISPKSLGITSTTSGNTLNFDITKPGKLVVTINGLEKLFIFIDAPESAPPKLTDANVLSLASYVPVKDGSSIQTTSIQTAIDAAASASKILYVPAGLYVSGELKLRTNSKVYLDAGAMIKGNAVPGDFPDTSFLYANGVTGVRIYGRGVIDANGIALKTASGTGAKTIRYQNTTNSSIDDIIVRDSGSWTVHLIGSDNISVSNMKIMNDLTNIEVDGIDPDMSSNINIAGNFIYTSDDCHAVKASAQRGVAKNTSAITVTDTTCWTKKSALKVGTETTYNLTGITFQNSNIVHADRAMSLYVANGGSLTDVHYIGNKSEYIGGDIRQKLLEFSITNGTAVGSMSGIEIRDWTAYSKAPNASTISGYDATHQITNVTFTNSTVAGVPIRSAADIPLTTSNASGLIYN